LITGLDRQITQRKHQPSLTLAIEKKNDGELSMNGGKKLFRDLPRLTGIAAQ